MKRQNFIKNTLSVIICLVLIAAIALTMTACGNKTANSSEKEDSQTLTESVQTLGEGATEFNLTVSDKEGKETVFTVKTDKKTVGDALLEVELIDGEMGDYGLYVKTVNGITADFDTDKSYWAFYENGEYAVSGVDMTKIDEKVKYSLEYTKE